MPDADRSVPGHYDVPGLPARILDRLSRAGRDPATVTRDDLAPFDEFHTGGRASTRELARLAGIAPGVRVLDVGSGVGGPARTLAAEFGGFVVGLDLTPEFCRAASMLTRLVALSDRAVFVEANALAMPFGDGSFDTAWSQNTIMNVPEKLRLFREVRRVLRPGGRFALEAVMSGAAPGIRYPTFWASSPEQNHLLAPEEARSLLREAGFVEERWEDRTAHTLERARARRRAAGDPAGAGGAAGAAAGGNDTVLGRDVIVPEGVAEKIENSIRNAEERRVAAIRAVLRRPV